MNHFTDKDGYKGISSQPVWKFKASQPRAIHHPVGAYFTTYGPSEPRLSVKIFVPKKKLTFMFAFLDADDLAPLPGGRGRNDHIFLSKSDYSVAKPRQEYAGEAVAYGSPENEAGGAS